MWKRLLIVAISGMALHAQPVRIVGNWLGTLEAGPQKLRMGLHITSNDKGELTSTLDSLDQNALGLRVQQTTFADNKLHLDIPVPPAQYDGTLSGDGNDAQAASSSPNVCVERKFPQPDFAPSVDSGSKADRVTASMSCRPYRNSKRYLLK